METENKKIWFKRKEYGWGWTPSSWEGWLVLAVYALVIVREVISIQKVAESEVPLPIRLIVPVVVSTLILIGVCYWKGEKPRWQWGSKDEKDNGQK